MCINRVNDW